MVSPYDDPERNGETMLQRRECRAAAFLTTVLLALAGCGGKSNAGGVARDGGGSGGCGGGGGSTVVDGGDGSTPSRPVTPARQTRVTKVDLLFMIDNSSSMADKQALLAQAVPDLVNRLVDPVCIDRATERQVG